MDTRNSLGALTLNCAEKDEVFKDFIALGFPSLKAMGLAPLPRKANAIRERDVAMEGKAVADGKEIDAIFSLPCLTASDAKELASGRNAMPYAWQAYGRGGLQTVFFWLSIGGRSLWKGMWQRTSHATA